jgi:hypothetical protein
MQTIKTGLALGAALLGVACGGAALPTDKLTAAESSMRAAEEVGAKSVPRAELHLKLAQEQVEQAKKLADDGDGDRAAQVLTRARADADLAIALAREAAVQKDLESKGSSSSQPSSPAAGTPTVSSVQ